MLDTNFGNYCTKCQLYQVCETKWYRGERGEEQVCCKSCRYYDDCLIEKVRKRVRLRQMIRDGLVKE